MYIKLFVVTLIIVGLALAGIAIKMFVLKNGEFKKQCSSVDAKGQRLGCGCGGNGDGSCERKSTNV